MASPFFCLKRMKMMLNWSQKHGFSVFGSKITAESRFRIASGIGNRVNRAGGELTKENAYFTIKSNSILADSKVCSSSMVVSLLLQTTRYAANWDCK